MNWEAIGAAGEIIGALAVVFSLIYLASQIRANNKLLQFEATRYSFDSMIPVIDHILADDKLVSLLLKEENSLNEIEKAKLLLMGRRVIQAIRQMWNSLDLLNPKTLEGMIITYEAMYHRPTFNYGMRLVWPDFRNAVEPEFAQWFEENIVKNQERGT